MALIRCAGADVQSGRISLGLRGAWWASLALGTDTAPTGQVKIETDGGLSLTGTVTQGGAFLLTSQVNLVGGAGGMATTVRGAYQQAQLGDVLGEILRTAGESQASSIASAILSIPLPQWTLGPSTASRALDELADAAAAYLGAPVNWRVLTDGAVWMGQETFTARALPADSVVAAVYPSDGRTTIGCSVPALMPGIGIDTIGQVRGVDHWIAPDRMRTWLWTS